MEDFKPNQRITAITQILVDNPYNLFPLKEFANRFNVAKSTLSEDLATIKSVFNELELGRIDTITGAAGGVRYLPLISQKEETEILNEIVMELNDEHRILPGNFIYMTDIIFSSKYSWKIGKIFASRFIDQRPDYIITIETKGIPLAMMTARAFNVPLVTIRTNNRVTEGSVLSINYISGSSRKIQTMSLARRALDEGVKVIVIDDFMKAGGTARGIKALMKEFGVKVQAIGVLIETKDPEEKLVDDYLSLLTLEEVNPQEQRVKVVPNV